MRWRGLFALPALLLLGVRGATAQLSAPGAAASPATEFIAGHVVSASDGHGLPQARVTLVDTANGKQVDDTTAGPEGAFQFAPVPAGRYRLSGAMEGFVTSAYLHHDQLSSAIVTGAGLATGDLRLELTPQGEIHGHVLSESGEPVERAQVQLFRESSPGAEQAIRQTRQTQTDDQGEFDLSGLVPGRFYLTVRATPWYAVFAPQPRSGGWMPYRTSVDPALQVVYPLTYYPNGRRPEEASPLEVHPGDSVTVDFQLTPEPAQTLSVLTPKPQVGQPMLFPQLEELVFGHPQPVPTNSEGGADGVLQIMGVAQGQYTLRAVRGGEGLGTAASHPVSVGSGAVTVDMTSPPVTATVRVSVHTGSGVSAGSRVSLEHEGELNGGSVKVDDHGVAEFHDVATGDYRVRVTGNSRVAPVQQVAVGGRVTSDRRIHVTSATPLAVDVTLASRTVQVRGTVLQAGKPVVGVVVVLVPAGTDTSAPLFRRDQTDLDGGFTLAGVPPGNYVLVAVQEGWLLAWTDTATMLHYLPQGMPLVVPETGGDTMRLPEPLKVQAR